MSEMVERAAQALCARVALDGGTEWDDSTEHQKNTYRGDARAMIEAMREPTMAMELAAQASDQRPSTIWGTMIDEALK